jgi:hypothetical protein
VTSGSSGTGSGPVAFSIAANTGAARSGTLTIAGQTFTVSQGASPPPPVCTITIAPKSQTFQKHGGSGSFTVTASAASCTWNATSNARWLTVTSGASGSGNGSVKFDVDDDSGGDRTGTISVGGQTFTVTQHGDSDEEF